MLILDLLVSLPAHESVSSWHNHFVSRLQHSLAHSFASFLSIAPSLSSSLCWSFTTSKVTSSLYFWDLWQTVVPFWSGYVMVRRWLLTGSAWVTDMVLRSERNHSFTRLCSSLSPGSSLNVRHTSHRSTRALLPLPPPSLEPAKDRLAQAGNMKQ